LAGCDAEDAGYFNGDTTKKARAQNELAIDARAKRDAAKSKYDAAHAETQRVAGIKQDAAQRYNNATKLAQAYATSEGTQAYTGKLETRGLDANGNLNKKNARVNRRHAAADRRLRTAAGEVSSATGGSALDGKIVGDVSTPMGAAEVYRASVKHAVSSYDNAATAFAEEAKSPTGEVIDVKSALASYAYKTKPGKATQYDAKAVRKAISAGKFDDQTKAVIEQRLESYSAAQDTYRSQNRVITQATTNARAARTSEQRIATNTTRYENISNENKVLTEVIRSGGNTKLTPQMVQMLNSVPGAHITAGSSPQDILATAKIARDQRTVEQANITKENNALKSQADQLRSSIQNMISGLANEINGMAPNAPRNNVATPNANGTNVANPNNVVNNITNNVANENSSSINAGLQAAASAVNPDRMTEAMYEKTQTEMLKANREMLERVRDQNREILDTVEDIEKEVMNS
jgi:hypothetical protein